LQGIHPREPVLEGFEALLELHDDALQVLDFVEGMEDQRWRGFSAPRDGPGRLRCREDISRRRHGNHGDLSKAHVEDMKLMEPGLKIEETADVLSQRN